MVSFISYFHQLFFKMNAELYQALQALTAEGKKPTVALLKHRVSGFSLPQLIDAIKRFNANPTSIKPQQPATAETAPLTLEQLQQQITQMAAQIEQLQTEVQQLKQRCD